jgi:hypothetical protein
MQLAPERGVRARLTCISITVIEKSADEAEIWRDEKPNCKLQF